MMHRATFASVKLQKMAGKGTKGDRAYIRIKMQHKFHSRLSCSCNFRKVGYKF
jgi:hypothetical protein